MVRRRKIQKPVKGRRNLSQGREISDLPDDLLHCILSFLTTKCAVCTGILSKRWKNVWTTIPNLDFLHWRSPTTVDIQSETRRFMNFMDRVLFLRGTTNIQKFALKCDELCDASRISRWISTVIWHNVEELNLNIKLNEQLFIPPSLFTCESLVELRLQTYSALRFPKSISFPKLKILRLFNITFGDENLTNRLFFSCPVLEDLILSDCTWENIQHICIAAPELKCLFIDSHQMGTLDRLHNCKVDIQAPSLVSLTYKGSVAKEYVLSSFSSLVDAEIGFGIEYNPDEARLEEIVRSAAKLFGQVSHVKCLMVCGEALKALSFAYDLPEFNNLIHLGVTSPVQCAAKSALINLIKTASYLESLVFYQRFLPCQTCNGWTLNMATGFLFLRLKSVHFKNFSGSNHEMDLAKLLLKNAFSLKKMIINSSLVIGDSLSLKVKVMGQLLRFSRGSRSCEIDFS